MTMPPHEGWRLIVQKRLYADGTCFDRGCEIAPGALGKNYQSLLDVGFVRWCQPSDKPSPVVPRKIETSAPTPKLVAIIADDWPSSVRATAAQPGCAWLTAQDLVIATAVGAEQHRLWQNAETERHSRANNLPGRRIYQRI